MRAKDFAPQAYKEFRKFLRENDPFVRAKHGHEFRIDKFLMDKDTSVTTTHGHVQSQIDEMLDQDGVRPQYTPGTNTPELNAKIERFWRTMATKTEAYLQQSGADRDQFRWFAMQHVIHTYNRLPTGANKMGNGEAPYTTLGIPFKAEKLVQFMKIVKSFIPLIE